MDSKVSNVSAHLSRYAAGATIILLLATSTPAQRRHSQLRPSKNYWDYWSGDARPTLHLIPVSKNRRLASVGDTLYMLDNRRRILWKWSADGEAFTDLPVIDSTGTIYVIGYDLLWAAIDSKTGRQKWRGTANGRATFSQIKLYRRNMYLVVTDMEGYRDSLRNKTIEDRLSLCRGNFILWESNIPAGAQIQLRNDQVFMIIARKHGAIRRAIAVPRSFSKPLGKVSSLVDDE
jgi:hypothetical protein